MPELPEIETVVRTLKPKLLGRKISNVDVLWQRTVSLPKKNFSAMLEGVRIEEVKRRGKYIIFDLSSDYKLITHLRMSGDLLVEEAGKPYEKHLRVGFNIGSKECLKFVDPRKFGRIYLVSDENEILSRLGVEPLSKHFNVEYLKAVFAKTKRPIKTVLLDQTIIAGIGNIYAVEALWEAKIHPRRKSSLLNETQIKKLHKAIINILSRAINSKGTDIGDGVWKRGAFVTKAYGRVGKPCRRCKTIIKRIVLAQRGTEFCPKCTKSK